MSVVTGINQNQIVQSELSIDRKKERPNFSNETLFRVDFGGADLDWRRFHLGDPHPGKFYRRRPCQRGLHPSQS